MSFSRTPLPCFDEYRARFTAPRYLSPKLYASESSCSLSTVSAHSLHSHYHSPTQSIGNLSTDNNSTCTIGNSYNCTESTLIPDDIEDYLSSDTLSEVTELESYANSTVSLDESHSESTYDTSTLCTSESFSQSSFFCDNPHTQSMSHYRMSTPRRGNFYNRRNPTRLSYYECRVPNCKDIAYYYDWDGNCWSRQCPSCVSSPNLLPCQCSLDNIDNNENYNHNTNCNRNRNRNCNQNCNRNRNRNNNANANTSRALARNHGGNHDLNINIDNNNSNQVDALAANQNLLRNKNKNKSYRTNHAAVYQPAAAAAVHPTCLHYHFHDQCVNLTDYPPPQPRYSHHYDPLSSCIEVACGKELVQCPPALPLQALPANYTHVSQNNHNNNYHHRRYSGSGGGHHYGVRFPWESCDCGCGSRVRECTSWQRRVRPDSYVADRIVYVDSRGRRRVEREIPVDVNLCVVC